MREPSNWNIAYPQENEPVSEQALAHQKIISQGLLINTLQDLLDRRNHYAASLESQVQMWRNLCIAAATLSVFICAVLHLVT